eukprot:TRINITY_DN368_c0_g1_i2.p1 TRINITY_DN368_c0_g1~~TRINITY_DN368_c0_g1_i2.p1  ORF type:complete len:495 (-),score=77.88 TRINITY_DN368_c0_g1_i2:167-1651(-)
MTTRTRAPSSSPSNSTTHTHTNTNTHPTHPYSPVRGSLPHCGCCQKDWRPLRLHRTLKSFPPALLSFGGGGGGADGETSHEMSAKRLSQLVKAWAENAPQIDVESESIISEFEDAPSATLELEPQLAPEDNVANYEELWNMLRLSIRSDVPLCQVCADRVISALRQNVEELRTDITRYERSLEAISLGSPPSVSKVTQSSKISAVPPSQSSHGTFSSPQFGPDGSQPQVPRQRALSARSLATLMNQPESLIAQEIPQLEISYWKSKARARDVHATELDRLSSIDAAIDRELCLLKERQSSSLLNDLYPIWYDGHFGTIAGFRLGRLPTHPVDWEELNAGLGMTASLVCQLGRLFKLQFSSYIIYPIGSQSKIKNISDGSVFELFGHSSSLKLFWLPRFDKALCGLLRCCQELNEKALSLERTFRPPYPISNDEVGGLSIKYQFAKEEAWTKSLKFLLSDLKMLVLFQEKKLPFDLHSRLAPILSSALQWMEDHT